MARCPTCGDELRADVIRCPRDGALLGEAHDPLAGATLAGRYRLVARLGKGGMSSVYLARHMLIDRLSAIKILRRELCSDQVHRDRFLREARAVNRIRHENIVEITDYGETEDGVVFLVMEYIPGESLLSHVARGRIAPDRAVDIASQMASALGRAHQMNVVHRDLKPDNVLLVPRDDGQDHVKILDFGIAKILDAPSLTLGDKIYGTPGYIAPEYASGGTITPRTDLYSFGVVLYEMVTGRLPFDVEFAGDLILKHLLEPPIPPRRRVPSLPASLEAVILKCLEKKAEHRHRDAFHLLEDLGRVRDELAREARVEAPDDAAEGIHIEGTSSARPSVRPPSIPARSVSRPPPPIASTPPEPTPPAPVADDEVRADEQLTLFRVLPPSILPVQAPTTGETRTSLLGLTVPDTGQTLEGPEVWADFLLAAERRLVEAFGPGIPPAAAQALDRMALLCAAMRDDVNRTNQMRARMLALEAKGRDFRSTIGRAMDALASDLSARERERDAIAERHAELEKRRAAATGLAAEETPTEGQADALLWEIAACDEVLRQSVAQCEDLEFQLRALGAQIDRLNEALEADQGTLVEDLTRTLQEVRASDDTLRGAVRALVTSLDLPSHPNR